MTRTECEDLIIQKLKEIRDIHRKYNPNSDYLSLCIMEKENYLAASNDYTESDLDYPIRRVEME